MSTLLIKLMSFRIHDDRLLEKYKNIQSMIEKLKGIRLTALQAHDDGFIRT